jgi:LPS export ABC transporter protein LptC
MAWERLSYRKKLKLFLFFSIIFIIGIVVATFANRRAADVDDTEAPLRQNDAGMAIGRVHQTATREGVTEWSLDAASVKYLEDQKKALLREVSITFFLKDGNQVHLTAEEGVLATDSKDIEVSGNVVVKHQDYRLKTERLRYEHEKRLLFCEVPVKISGEHFELEADAMSVDLNQKSAWFEGHVNGNISQDTAI